MEITSINNSKVKDWLKLKIKKNRDKKEEFLIEGSHLVDIAVAKNLVTSIIAIDKKYEIEGIPFYLVNDAIMKKLTNQVSISPVIAIAKKIPSREIKGNVIILDNIQDPGNLGTIIRSSVAFDIDTIVVSEDTVDIYNDKVIRSTEGMLFNINFKVGNLEDIILDLKNKGYSIYGTDVKRGKCLKNVSFSKKTGIIIGNEGQGMKEEYKKYTDELINIPISNSCESLNASVAASIILYEQSR